MWSDARFNLLGCRPTRSGELWPCILEKAVTAHCGGWVFIHGGTITHAWSLLTGCREVYTIKRSRKNCYAAFGSYNPNTKAWEKMANAPHVHSRHCFQGLWPMMWPRVGGGGRLGKRIDQHELFQKMCAWEDTNYLMATLRVKDGGKAEGTVVGFLYTIRR